MTTCKPLPAFIAVLFVAQLAGCMAAEPPDQATLPSDLMATYRAEGGEELRVSLEGLEEVRNATGAMVPAIKFRHEWGFPPSGDPTIHLANEFIDPLTGLIIRHDVYCVPVGVELGVDPCEEGRLHVEYGAAGLPGGLGAGPTWFAASFFNDGVHVFESALGGELIYDFDGKRDGSCTRVTATLKRTESKLRVWTPVTVLEEPWMKCPGLLLPTTFVPSKPLWESHSTQAKPEFDLVEYRAGDDALSLPSRVVADAGCHDAWLQEGLMQSPLAVRDFEPFPSLEAHRKARELDGTYRALSTEDSRNVVRAQLTTGGAFVSNVPLRPSWQEHTWDLAVSDGQDYYRLAITKRVEEATLVAQPNASFSIEDARHTDPEEVGLLLDASMLRLSIQSVSTMIWPFAPFEPTGVTMDQTGRYKDIGQHRILMGHDYRAISYFITPEQSEQGVVFPLWVEMDSTGPAVKELRIRPDQRDIVETMNWCPA